MAQWSFVLTDQNFVPQGEILNMQERRVNLPLSKIDSCSFRVLADNPFKQQLLACEGYIKGYREGVLRFFGPILTAQESAEAGKSTVAVNAVGQGWVLSRRYALPDTNAAAVDRAVRFKGIMDNQWNYPSAATGSKRAPISGLHAFTHIISTVTPSAASTAIYTFTEKKLLSTILGELSAGPTGFDWRILPVENFDFDAAEVDWHAPLGGGTYSQETTDIGDFRAAPIIGLLKEDVFFEYGESTGKANMVSYNRVGSRESQANFVYHDQPEAAPITVTSYDTGSLGQWGYLDDVIDAELYDADLRQDLADAHIGIRKQPRQRIDFQPVASLDPDRVPQFGSEFDVGDTIRARAAGSFDALFRIWGVTFDIDANGVEKMTLSVSEDEA